MFVTFQLNSPNNTSQRYSKNDEIYLPILDRFTFLSPTERFGGYSDRPGVRLSVRPPVDETLCGP